MSGAAYAKRYFYVFPSGQLCRHIIFESDMRRLRNAYVSERTVWYMEDWCVFYGVSYMVCQWGAHLPMVMCEYVETALSLYAVRCRLYDACQDVQCTVPELSCQAGQVAIKLRVAKRMSFENGRLVRRPSL